MNTMIRTAIMAAVALLFGCATVQQASAASRHERKEAERAQSAEPQDVSGGAMMQSASNIDKVFDVVLNELKSEGHGIERADRVAGEIITAMQIKGGYSQTGTRIQVTLIKKDGDHTMLRVAVTEQKRKKALQAEPWSDAKVDMEQSSEIAAKLMSILDTPAIQPRN